MEKAYIKINPAIPNREGDIKGKKEKRKNNNKKRENLCNFPLLCNLHVIFMMLDKERFVHWYYKYKGKISSTQLTKNTRIKLSSRKSRSILNIDTSQKYPTKPFNQKWKRKLTSPKNPIPTSISNESHSQNEYKWLKFEDKGESPEANFPFLVTIHIITDRVEW